MSDAHGPLRQRTVKEQRRSPSPEVQDQALGSSAELVSAHGRTAVCHLGAPRGCAAQRGS